MRNLVLAFDGTWNTPDLNPADGDESTNVWRFVQSLLPRNASGVLQRSWYITGVGTDPFERLRGGILGEGLGEKILQGYNILTQHYRKGDRVFLMGFSRGAYTARSLAGLIDRLGLVNERDDSLVKNAYQLYREGSLGEQQRFKAAHAHSMPIEALAVWDTVGALGIPLGLFEPLNRSRYEFHHTRLGAGVRHAYQALAIDEHREDYAATLWKPSKPAQQLQQRIEQRWFVGSHSDVGGGYQDNRLSQPSLRWIQRRLAALGLETEPVPMGRILSLLPTDSWNSFLAGAYAFGSPRYLRPVGFTEHGGECLAATTLERVRSGGYLPGNRVGRFLKRYHPSIKHLADYKHLSDPIEHRILT